MTMKPGIIEEVQDGVFQLEKVLSSGWGMTMTVVRLTGPDLLVYSPVWIDDQTFAQLAKVGRPKVLVAPNHFHHLSLRPFTERYPDAMVIASPVALPRLLRKGYQGLRPGAEAEPLLPQNLRFVVPEGTRNGEVWLSLSEANGRCTWVIADAFFNVTRPVTGVTGAALRLLNVVPGLKMSRTFRLLGIGDAKAYKAFLLGALARERPENLLFSHGDPLESSDLPWQLEQLLAPLA